LILLAVEVVSEGDYEQNIFGADNSTIQVFSLLGF